MSVLAVAALALALVAQPPVSQPAAPDSAARRPAADSAVAAPRDTRHVTITFENQSLEVATIYVVSQSGYRARIGQVIPGRTQRLVVPRGVVGAASTVDIVAVSIGRRVIARSGPVNLSPGDSYSASLSSLANIVSVLPAR
jgi:hypothetical protein